MKTVIVSITEKSLQLFNERSTFIVLVPKKINKVEIKNLVEADFDIKVAKVRTLKSTW